LGARRRSQCPYRCGGLRARFHRRRARGRRRRRTGVHALSNLRFQAVVNGEPRMWPLEGERLGIGRSSRNTIQIAHATVSKDHAEVLHQSDGWWISDLGSRNGTRVNGAEVTQPVHLKAGDLLEVGSVLLRTLGEGEEARTQWTPSPGASSSLRINARDILGRSSATTSNPGLVHVLIEAGRVL